MPESRTRKRTAPFTDRFWAKVDRDGPNGCWLWTGAKDRKGYGRIQRGRRGEGIIKAHRASWLIHFGEDPDLCVLHRCDVPGCVNPAHLFLGTIADNNADMHAKGRAFVPNPVTGPEHHSAKLSTYEVGVVRGSTESSTVLAARYGVAVSTICRIRRGEYRAKG